MIFCGRRVGDSPAALSCRPCTVLLHFVGRVALVSLEGGGHALLLPHGCVMHHARSLPLLSVLFGGFFGTVGGPYFFCGRFFPPTFPPRSCPLQDVATDQAVQALGMGEAVNAYNSLSGSAADYVRVGQWVHKSVFS